MEESLKETIKNQLQTMNVDQVYTMHKCTVSIEEVVCIKNNLEPKKWTKNEKWGEDPTRDVLNYARFVFGIDKDIVDCIIGAYSESKAIYDCKHGTSRSSTILDVAVRLMKENQKTRFGNLMGIKPNKLLELFKSDEVGSIMPFMSKKNPARSLATTLANYAKKEETTVYRNEEDTTYFFVVDELHQLPSLEKRKELNGIEEEDTENIND